MTPASCCLCCCSLLRLFVAAEAMCALGDMWAAQAAQRGGPPHKEACNAEADRW